MLLCFYEYIFRLNDTRMSLSNSILTFSSPIDTTYVTDSITVFGVQ